MQNLETFFLLLSLNGGLILLLALADWIGAHIKTNRGQDWPADQLHGAHQAPTSTLARE